MNLLTDALGKAMDRQLLREQAEIDPLTGIGNRRRTMRSLAAAIGLAERSGDQVGVVYLDLDHFKRVNDTNGHDVGDKVLFAFAQHLAGIVRVYDTVNRIGGEEFVIVCPGLDERGGEVLGATNPRRDSRPRVRVRFLRVGGKRPPRGLRAIPNPRPTPRVC